MNFTGAPSFVAEEQTVAASKGSVPNGFVCVRSQEVYVLRPFPGADETTPVLMFDHIKRFPVIHSGPFEVLVGNLKAEGVNQVKSTVGEGTNSTDVSSVLRDLRAIQDDFYHRFIEFFNAWSASLWATRFFRSCLLSRWFFPVPTAIWHLIKASLK